MNVFNGIVQEGTKRAAKLGFPTINILLNSTDASGVYVARVRMKKSTHEAVAFADQERHVLEAHLLDFAPKDLYGKEADIELFEKLRDSEYFLNDELLRTAIARDVERAREYFRKHTI